MLELLNDTDSSNRNSTDAEVIVDNILGTLMALLAFLGAAVNISIVYIMTRYKSLRSRTSCILSSMAVCDGLMALVGAPMYAVNCFFHRWMFYHAGCQFYSFLMFWCGVTSIAHLVAVAMERLVTMKGSFSRSSKRPVTKSLVAVIALCWIYGLVWALLPLVGVQSYVVEGRVSCSINWESRKSLDVAYCVVIFFVVFLVPLTVIVITNSVIVQVVMKSQKRLSCQSGTDRVINKEQKQQRIEWKLTKSLIAATAMYLIAWTPYACLAMWASFGDASNTPDLWKTSLAFFAKTSFIFNPIIYSGGHRQYRTRLLRIVCQFLNDKITQTSSAISHQFKRSTPSVAPSQPGSSAAKTRHSSGNNNQVNAAELKERMEDLQKERMEPL